MTREEVIKKFEFDLRFKYNPGFFRVTNRKLLEFLYELTTEILKISTNSAYIEYLLENSKFHGIKIDYSIDCVFLIDLENKRSDVYSYSNYNTRRQRQDNLPKLYNLPDYLKKYIQEQN